MISGVRESNGTTFQSRIKIVSPQKFKSMTTHWNPKKCEVGYPWQPENTKSGKKLFTKNIMDCIAGVVINKDGARMFHLATLSRGNAMTHRLKGFDIKHAEQRIFDGVDLSDKTTHAFILGGFKTEPEKNKYNWKILDKIKKIFKDRKIPYTIMGGRKDVHYFGKFSFLYRKKDDTIYVTNNLINGRSITGSGLEMEIFKNRRMKFHTYQRIEEGNDFRYQRTCKFGTQQDFMESQFREVKLSQFDSWA